jgi:hypothetical protein
MNLAGGVSEGGRKAAADGERFLAVGHGGNCRPRHGDRLEVDVSQSEVRAVVADPAVHFGVASGQALGEIQRPDGERPSSFRFRKFRLRQIFATPLDGRRRSLGDRGRFQPFFFARARENLKI